MSFEDPQFTATYQQSAALYARYQTAVHGDDPGECSESEVLHDYSSLSVYMSSGNNDSGAAASSSSNVQLNTTVIVQTSPAYAVNVVQRKRNSFNYMFVKFKQFSFGAQ